MFAFMIFHFYIQLNIDYVLCWTLVHLEDGSYGAVSPGLQLTGCNNVVCGKTWEAAIPSFLEPFGSKDAMYRIHVTPSC